MKHKPTQEFPKFEAIKDQAMQAFCKELGDTFLRSMRNIADDLQTIETVEVVSALPTAAKTNWGKFYLLITTGADWLYICIDTGGSGFTFKKITL